MLADCFLEVDNGVHTEPHCSIIEIKQKLKGLGMIDAKCPVKRAVECEEVGDAVAYLLSSSASYITGTSLLVDAGITRLSVCFRFGQYGYECFCGSNT